MLAWMLNNTIYLVEGCSESKVTSCYIMMKVIFSSLKCVPLFTLLHTSARGNTDRFLKMCTYTNKMNAEYGQKALFIAISNVDHKWGLRQFFLLLLLLFFFCFLIAFWTTSEFDLYVCKSDDVHLGFRKKRMQMLTLTQYDLVECCKTHFLNDFF